ncbi:MAG: glycine cleavage system protein GcvH [Nitrospirae bacterium]|nr:glycine cleavage system protein GcvH [Nitrospirota bacterium]
MKKKKGTGFEFPEDLKYTREHEWGRKEDDGIVTVGISDYAQDALGDIVYVELPEEGEEVLKGESFGFVESVKSVSDLYAPVSGKVVEVNLDVKETPDLLNQDPYGDGWLIKISLGDAAELDELMNSVEYAAFVEEEIEKGEGEEE